MTNDSLQQESFFNMTFTFRQHKTGVFSVYRYQQKNRLFWFLEKLIK